MTIDDTQDGPTYRVVVNDEEQYSVWPEARDRPAGWSDGGFAGAYDDCLAFIEEHWTDMRPRSARDHAD